MSGGGKSQNVTQTNKTEIPAFLQPYLQNQAQIGSDALTSLQQTVNGGSYPTYDTAPTASQQFLKDATMRQFQGGGTFDTAVKGLNAIASGSAIPEKTTATLNSLMDTFQLDPVAQQAISGMAAGQGFGSPAFDEAVQASIRAAQPVIASTFASGGNGALKSGLAQIGMQQAASDAFSRLYGDERNRQLASATQLGNFQLSGRDQQMNAAMGLGSLNLQQQAQQMAALNSLPGIGMMGQQMIGNVADMEQQQKDRAYQESLSPIQQQMMLFQAAQGLPVQSLLGGSSTQPVFRNQTAGALGGAAAGGQLGYSIGGPYGAAIGAVGGGLLGAYG